MIREDTHQTLPNLSGKAAVSSARKLLRLGEVVNGLRVYLHASDNKDAKSEAEYGQKPKKEVIKTLVKHFLPYPTTLLHNKVSY